MNYQSIRTECFCGGVSTESKAGKAVVEFLACCLSCASVNMEQQTHSGLWLYPWHWEPGIKCGPEYAEVNGVTFITSTSDIICGINNCLHLLVWIHMDIQNSLSQ